MDDAVQVTAGSAEHARHSTSTRAIKRFHPTKRSRRVFICLDSKKPGNLDSLNRFRFPLGFHQEGLGRGFRAKFDYYLDIVGEFSQTGSVLKDTQIILIRSADVDLNRKCRCGSKFWWKKLFKFHFASSTFQVQKFLNLIVYPQTKL
jgi:hypothetical protein